MSKRRSRRLRKRLRVEEFQELGFEIRVQYTAINVQVSDSLLDDFLDCVIEPRRLAFGGSLPGGFICAASRGSATEEDRHAVNNWLRSQPEIIAVEIGELVDAWYGFAGESELKMLQLQP